jgi:two-component system, chemotaxis family, CheB/CheR fusion protein
VGVVINNDLEILHFRGQTSLYLEPAPGRASHNLLKMAKDDLKLELRTLIHQAKQRKSVMRKDRIQIQVGDRLKQVSLEVIPLNTHGTQERYFLVLFVENTVAIAPAHNDSIVQHDIEIGQNRQMSDEHEIARLNQELADTKEYLRSIIEEQEATNQDLRVANEEILSSNEEFHDQRRITKAESRTHPS